VEEETISDNTKKDRLPAFRKTLASYITQPVVSVLARTLITPDMVTIFGFIVVLGAAALIGTGHLFAAGFVVLASGYFDIIDGALARRTNQTTQFGAVLDSTLDRISEAVVLIGIIAYFLFEGEKSWTIILSGVCLTGSFLVSYIRARAEGLGIECQVGIFTRTERVIILAIGLLIDQLSIVLAIITFLSLITAGQRMFEVYRLTRANRKQV
jgi:CDP-diacylglycerol---glycerol-3-phosphate 3-phosphatidyltransferase